MFLFLAEIGHFHLVAGTMHGYDLLQLAVLVDFLAIDGRHDVAFLQTGSIGCAVCGDFCDIEAGECAEVGFFALVFLFVDVVRHRSSADAQQRALHYAKFAEVFHHLVHNGGRDSKAVSAVRTRFGVDHRVDADQFARSIDECTAGVTGIDGGIGLNEAFYRIGRLHGTGFRADDAGSDGGGEAIRIADGEHPFSDFQFLTATYGDGLQVFGFDLDQSEIRIFVLSDDTAFELAIVIEFYQNLVSIFHNVVVGDDISVGGEDNSRAGSATFGRLTRLLLARCALAEEISEKVFEGIEVLHVLFGSRGGNLYVDDRVECFVGRNRQIDGLRHRTALCGRGNRSGKFGAFHCHCFRCCANGCGKKESRNDFHVHMYSFIGLF